MKQLKRILIILFLLNGLGVVAQHGIGTNDANPDAVLDVVATDKGVLLPRVFLTSANILAPITGTANESHNGMTVYNTNPAINSGLTGVGYYYWAGGTSGSWNHLVVPASPLNAGNFLRWNGNNWQPNAPTDNYSVFSIWAEEAGTLGNNLFEWGFGNGDDAAITQGIPIPVSGDLFAVGVSLVGATSSTINVLVNGAVAATTTPYTGTGSDITNLLTPVSVSAGDLINFQTNIAGGANEGKVVAWFRTGTISNLSSNDMNDVDTSAGASSGDFLQWNGTDWVVRSPNPGLNDTIDSLNDGDTTTTPPTIGDFLHWNGTHWVPFSPPIIPADINAVASISNATIIDFNNNTAFTDRALATVNFNEFTVPDVTPGGTGFTINTAGTYYIEYSGQFIIAAGERPTIIIQINAGGNVGGQDFVYLRNLSSITQGGASGSMVVQLNATDTVRLQSRREGSITNAVNTDGVGIVNMSIKRLR